MQSDANAWKAIRIVMVVWFLFALVCGIRTAIAPEKHTVFPTLAGSAQRFWSDQPLYGDYPPLDYFRYPPVFALAITPFFNCGLTLGGILWIWFGLSVFGLGLLAFQRHVLPSLEWKTGQIISYYFLALIIAAPGIANGQSNSLAIGLLLLGYAEIAREKPIHAGAWLAASVAVKLTPLAVVLILCVIFPRKLPLPFLLGLTLIGMIPFLVLPAFSVLRDYEEWITHLAHTSAKRWPGFRDAWTLTQVAESLLGWNDRGIDLKAPLESVSYRLWQLGTAALTLGLAWVANRTLENPREKLSLILAFPLAWLMLFGPAVEHAGFAFLAPVLAWTLVDGWRSLIAKILFIIAGILILIIPPISSGLFHLAALPLGVLFFYFGLIVSLIRSD